ncbi:MAG: hypothetical protein M5U08_05125 [Burkholderiales bacterium]|nr:hypothetical protein [Burkholderiales bacterium]
MTGPDVIDAYTRQVLKTVAHLVGLRERTGRTVTLALEPEPACFLEVTSEVIDYFGRHLYSAASVEALARQAGLSKPQAEEALRRHLGTVFDICHQAVEYEDIAEALGSLKRAGVPVFKLQAAAAIRIPQVTQEVVKALEAYDDPVYLHQTVEVKDGKLSRFVDLQEAFAAFRNDPGPREWRIHFHVPVFLESLGPLFKTTRPAIEEALRVHKADAVSTQVEIETYTWDVLPDELKTGDIVDYVVRGARMGARSARLTRRSRAIAAQESVCGPTRRSRDTAPEWCNRGTEARNAAVRQFDDLLDPRVRAEDGLPEVRGVCTQPRKRESIAPPKGRSPRAGRPLGHRARADDVMRRFAK